MHMFNGSYSHGVGYQDVETSTETKVYNTLCYEKTDVDCMCCDMIQEETN